MDIMRPGNSLYLYAYIWLLIPCLMFLSGWTKTYIALPACVLLCYGVWKSVSTLSPQPYTPVRTNRRMIWSLALLTAWVLLSGLGGLMWQDYWDHGFRNAVYFDLVSHTWPVTDIENGDPALLCYYFGFWLPSAFIAKLTGSIEAGYWLQFLYGLAGTILALLMIFRYLGSVRIRTVVIFTLFCGWDIIAWLILEDDISIYKAVFALKDLCYEGFSSPSATTQLYFIYNQGIAIWLTIMLLLRQRDNAGTLLLTYSLLAIFSPIASAALAPVVIYCCLRHWRQAVSAPNAAGLLFGMTAVAFYMSNSRVGGFGLNEWGTIPVFLLFLICSYGVFMPFVWRRLRNDRIFWWLFGTMIVLSWTRLGDTGDMAWRCTIPVSFYLMLALMKKSVTIRSWSEIRHAAFACVLATGMLAPLGILARSAGHQLQYWRGILHSTRSDGYPTLFMENICHDNFIAHGDSFFTRYMMRDRESTAFADNHTKSK